VPLEIASTPDNIEYLRTKKEKMRHRLDLADGGRATEMGRD
jgi:hypothetical protein